MNNLIVTICGILSLFGIIGTTVGLVLSFWEDWLFVLAAFLAGFLFPLAFPAGDIKIGIFFGLLFASNTLFFGWLAGKRSHRKYSIWKKYWTKLINK